MPISLFTKRHRFKTSERGMLMAEQCEHELVKKGYKMMYQDYDGVSRNRYFRQHPGKAETVSLTLTFDR